MRRSVKRPPEPGSGLGGPGLRGWRAACGGGAGAFSTTRTACWHLSQASSVRSGAKASGSDEVELFARAGGRGPWRLALVADVGQDLAHDDGMQESYRSNPTVTESLRSEKRGIQFPVNPTTQVRFCSWSRPSTKPRTRG